ncbi:molecular chaperone DnaJ [Candidatus Peregrinibacteria bacterium]|nr:molecular chaperone DnaJ [Candidatus Peregrinibacteria bacterium]
MTKDLYAVLGLERNASIDDIKKAYRRLSKELHPDRQKGNKETEKRFKEVNEAYEILSDAKKKESYDRFGYDARSSGFHGSPFEGFSAEGFGGLGDIFEQFFGGGKRTGSQARGEDHEVQVQISFKESAEGIEKPITFARTVSCEECGGTGGQREAQMISCEKCGGTGQVRRATPSFFGEILERVLCEGCRGSGRVPNRLCTHCRGEGHVRVSQEEKVHIPAGIADGQTIRIQGKGDVGFRGGSPGDLFVTVRVLNDKRFTRDGNDVRSTVHVPLITALLGGECPIDTVQDTATLKIPAGTQSHQLFRLRGKGMPVVGTSRYGDHYATVVVDIPTKLSRREQELIEEWQSLA